MLDILTCPFDMYYSVFKVNIGPFKSHKLATPHTAKYKQVHSGFSFDRFIVKKFKNMLNLFVIKEISFGMVKLGSFHIVAVGYIKRNYSVSCSLCKNSADEPVVMQYCF